LGNGWERKKSMQIDLTECVMICYNTERQSKRLQ